MSYVEPQSLKSNIERLAVGQAAGATSWFEDCEVEPEEWLIERLVPRRSYTGVFGRRGAAKSFLALEMACCGAAGVPFLGERVEPFGSLYCVGEKKARFGKRVEAWKRSRGLQSLPLLLRWGVPDLLNDAAVRAFVTEILALKPEFEARGAPLGAIFIDTLSRALKGANVSDADATGTALNNIQYMIDEAGVAVLPLAHVAKAEGSITQKGAGEWEDAADALIRIERRESEALRTVTLTKQSDEADGLAYGFELDVVDIAETPSGRRITSCVIRQVEVPDSGTNRRILRLNAAADTVLSALGRLTDAGQLEPVFCPGAPRGTKGARIEALRAKAYEMGLQRASQPQDDAPQTEKNKWLEARKKAFQRAVDRLQEARKIRVEGDFVWAL